MGKNTKCQQIFNAKKYSMAKDTKCQKIPNNKNASIAKEIVRMIMDEQNESDEFDFDDAETYIVDILKKHGIK